MPGFALRIGLSAKCFDSHSLHHFGQNQDCGVTGGFLTGGAHDFLLVIKVGSPGGNNPVLHLGRVATLIGQ
jgi:hypothetical protein